MPKAYTEYTQVSEYRWHWLRDSEIIISFILEVLLSLT